MDLIFRSALVYFIILVILRISGKRTLSQITTFDFVLLLIIGEATQQALLSFDHSITGAVLVIATLVIIDFLVSVFSYKFKLFDKVANGVPILNARFRAGISAHFKTKARDSFYIGMSHDPTSRLEKHNRIHKGYTSRKRPWKIVYTESFTTKKEALLREKEIKKKKSRDYIIQLMKLVS